MLENVIKQKHFVLNCSVCDSRQIIETTLDGFDNIVINTDLFLQNSFSKNLLNKYPIVMNCDTTIDTDKEIVLKENLTISTDTFIEEDKIYVITEKLNIEKGSKNVIQNIHKAYVTGFAQLPESIENCLSNFVFSGNTLVYPDNSVVLKNHTIIDDIFEITSKENTLYFAKDKIVISKINLETLISKNIKFKTKKLVIDKSLLKQALPIFNDDVELELIENNAIYYNGNTNLDLNFIKKYGDNIYIDGNVNINSDSDFKNIKYLFVNGDVNIIKRLQEDFSKINANYHKMNFVKGKFLGNAGMITIDKFVLEANQDGISAGNCGSITINENVSPEQIINNLQISNCGSVSCFEEQIGAVHLIAQNVGNISIADPNKKSNPLKDIMEMLSNKVVNADYYTL